LIKSEDLSFGEINRKRIVNSNGKSKFESVEEEIKSMDDTQYSESEFEEHSKSSDITSNN
jgi:hypothetical protein